jgi:RimJ/RimL family protein N-acetyltransferase
MTAFGSLRHRAALLLRAPSCHDATVPAPVDLPDLRDGSIRLRPWVAADARFLLDASQDPAIQRYSLSRDRPFTADEAREELRDCESTWLTFNALGRPTGSLVIADALTGASLGQFGIDGWFEGDCAQIGYWLAPQARGQGIATRAVVRLTSWLIGLGAKRVFLTVVEDNKRSAGVAERAGFGLEGPTGEPKFWQGRPLDVLRFAVTAQDWQQRR